MNYDRYLHVPSSPWSKIYEVVKSERNPGANETQSTWVPNLLKDNMQRGYVCVYTLLCTAHQLLHLKLHKASSLPNVNMASALSISPFCVAVSSLLSQRILRNKIIFALNGIMVRKSKKHNIIIRIYTLTCKEAVLEPIVLAHICCTIKFSSSVTNLKVIMSPRSFVSYKVCLPQLARGLVESLRANKRREGCWDTYCKVKEPLFY
jgi:hypothetical protein